MTARGFARVLAAPVCLALGWALWRHWTGLCNEACAPERSAAMILLAFALPLVGYSTLFHLTAASPGRVATRVLVALSALLILAAFWVNHAP